MGFGISSGPAEGLGLGPDEVYDKTVAVLERLEDVLTKGQNTVPLKELSLKRLREMRRITQEELAKALAITQASVSKMESRSDIRLSTLYKFIEAMGGKLELVARFPEVEVMINPFAEGVQEDHPEAP
jgi:DNA-binding Xre family transcriptional regulator